MKPEEILQRMRDILEARIHDEMCALDCAQEWAVSALKKYNDDIKFFGTGDRGEFEAACADERLAKTRLSLMNGILHDIEVIEQELELGDDAIPEEGELNG